MACSRERICSVFCAGWRLAYKISIDFDCMYLTKQFRTKSIPRKKKHIYFTLDIIRCKLDRKIEKSIKLHEVSEKEYIMLKSRNMHTYVLQKYISTNCYSWITIKRPKTKGHFGIFLRKKRNKEGRKSSSPTRSGGTDKGMRKL